MTVATPWPAPLSAVLIGLLAILTGCASLDARAARAGAQKGTVQARVTLPELPGDCRALEPHAALQAGSELRSVLKRERGALDRANLRVTRCAENYDAVSEALR